MADAGQFANDADILLRAGANASGTVTTAGWFDSIVVDVEAFINCATRYDWSTLDAAGALHASTRGILVDTAACLAAIEGISYDMSGFTSRSEAETMMLTLRDIAMRNISILRDKKTQKFITEKGAA